MKTEELLAPNMILDFAFLDLAFQEEPILHFWSHALYQPSLASPGIAQCQDFRQGPLFHGVGDTKQTKIPLAAGIQHRAFANFRAIMRPEPEMSHSCWKARRLSPSIHTANHSSQQNKMFPFIIIYLKKERNKKSHAKH